jgi:hypothetical protein
VGYGLSALALVVLVMPSVAGAQGYGYLYIQDNILIQSGANSFVGMHIGDDGLPYTADDLDLTANVETAGDNPGGVFSGFNYVTSGTPSAPSGFPTVGSINFYGDNLYRAHVRQAGLAHDGSFDDDGIGWARNGRFFRGRIAEADHWSDQNLVGVDLDAAGTSTGISSTTTVTRIGTTSATPVSITTPGRISTARATRDTIFRSTTPTPSMPSTGRPSGAPSIVP